MASKIFVVAVVVLAAVSSAESSCATQDKRKCVFPFKYRGVTYNGCTTVRNNGKLWCSTENAADGNYKKWGNCDVAVCKKYCRSWKRVGCFASKSGAVLFSDEDGSSGKFVDWDNYETYLNELVCRCSKAAAGKNFPYFALQSFGVCVGLKSKASKTVDLFDERCFDSGFGTCNPEKEVCIGANEYQFVYETKVVNLDGGFSEYGPWSTCNKKCGGGVQSRSRTCSNPAPKGSGKKCSGPTSESRKCNEEVCNVNGGWSAYGKWSACSKTCGDGVQSRARTCTNPAPSGSGKQCEGPTEQKQKCRVRTCGSGYKKIASSKSCRDTYVYKKYQKTLESCAQACFGSSTVFVYGKTKNRCSSSGCACYCINGASKDGKCGKPYKHSYFDTYRFNGVDGGWSAYGPWGKCSRFCGGGTQSRSRSCSSPKTIAPGKECVGGATETRQCPAKPCPECVYESGDAFGAEKQNVGAVANQKECAEKCAELKIKDMSINAAVVDAKTGKQCSCVKKATARRRNPDLNSCFFKMDGVDGGWSKEGIQLWCSAPCGGGFGMTTRFCNNPTPIPPGKGCQGYAEVEGPCNMHPC